MQLRRSIPTRFLWKFVLVSGMIVLLYISVSFKYLGEYKHIRDSFLAQVYTKRSTDTSDENDLMGEVIRNDQTAANDKPYTTKQFLLDKVRTGIIEYPNEKYHVIPNLLSPDRTGLVPKDNSIVLCTQTSLGNLHLLKSLALTWDGEVSVAVFSFDDEISLALQYILLLHTCSTIIKRNTRFHLVYPMSHSPTDIESFSKMKVQCKDLSKFQDQFNVENYDLNNIPYPVNILRNVAYMYSISPFVFNLDIDFTPANNLRVDMEAFLKARTAAEKEKKTAYIIPCFETNSTLYIQSKKDLLLAVNNGSVRQFTQDKCYRCHIATNYSRWMALPFPRDMAVGYYIEFKMPHEPYFIADKKRMPMFDARFKQYGMNRVSQICETYYSGYDFAVMNNGFVIHSGFKDGGKFYQWKQSQNRYNRGIYDKLFLQDLQLRHPNSTRQCIYMDSNPQAPKPPTPNNTTQKQ